MAREFGRNITIDGSGNSRAQRYEGDVAAELTAITMFQTGHIVIQEIWQSQRRLRIVPWTRREQNASAGPVNPADAQPEGARVLDGVGEPIGNQRGTGRGSDALVRYTPARFEADVSGWSPAVRQVWQRVTGHAPPEPGDDRSEVLVHELVHAVREMAGVYHPGRIGHELDTREELFAILVANLYNLERMRQLRAAHVAHAPALSDYHAWMMDREIRIAIFAMMADMPRFGNALARVPVSPNPFAQYGVPTVPDMFWGSDRPA